MTTNAYTPEMAAADLLDDARELIARMRETVPPDMREEVDDWLADAEDAGIGVPGGGHYVDAATQTGMYDY